MSQIQEISLNPPVQGVSSNQTMVAATAGRVLVGATQRGYWVISPTEDCFICRGGASTNAAPDVDLFLVGGQQYRIGPITPGEYLCWYSTAGGNLYITPGA